MAGPPQPSPYDFGKYKLVITSAEGKEVDVSNLVVELNFFESLKDPYVNGNFLILDSANVFNYVNFRGQEIVKITVTDFYDNIKINKTFAITAVNKHVKTADSSSAYIVTFHDVHMYKNQKTVFSKALVGKPEDIIQQALGEVGIGVNKETSAQKKMRFIVPFTMNPVSVAHTMKNRMTTATGSPFFLHGSVYNSNLALKSLDTLLNQPAFNTQPFKYSSVAEIETNSEYTVEQFNSLSHRIAAVNFDRNQDALQQFEKAGFGSQYIWVDTYKDKADEERYKVIDPLRTLPKPNGLDDYAATLPNELGKPLHESVSRYISEITTRQSFPEPDIYAYHEEKEIDRHNYKSKARGLKSFSIKSFITMQLPGYEFFGKDLMGANLIDVYVPKDLPIEFEASADFIKDKKRSGKYLMTNIRHMFKNSQYSVTVAGLKFDNDRGIASEQFYKGEVN